MPETDQPPRSPRLLDAAACALLVIDMQQRLLAALPDGPRLVANAARLLEAAALLEVRRGATEQYPKGLGETDPQIRRRVDQPPEKLIFSAAGCRGLVDPLAAAGVRQIVLCGIETHVCVLQTALDLLAESYDVYVVVDAVGSRHQADHDVALQRMRDEGASLVTTESVMFEWCRTAEHPEFKQISALVKQSPALTLPNK